MQLDVRSGSVVTSPDIVANFFSGWRSKMFIAADASYAGRGEGPYRSIQNRSLTSVGALTCAATVEKAKDPHSRDCLPRPIFDFYNNILRQADIAAPRAKVTCGPTAAPCAAAKRTCYSITSSARASSVAGNCRPSCLAAFDQ